MKLPQISGKELINKSTELTPEEIFS